MKQKRDKYIQGVCWFILSLCLNASNDALTKFLNRTSTSVIDFWQVTFLRFAIGTLLLFSWGLSQPKKALHTSYKVLHLLRGGALVVAMMLWAHGLAHSTMTTATIISFSIPLFVLIFSAIFLKEKVTSRLALFTLLGFAGVILVVYSTSETSWNSYTLVFVGAVNIFALLDVINKYYLNKESLFSMIFYPTLLATLFTMPCAYYYWKPLTYVEWVQMSLLGTGGTLITYCLLRAYRCTSLVSLAFIRYIELFFSMLVSRIVFQEKPGNELFGTLLIIPTVLTIIYDQHKTRQKDDEL